MGVTVATRAAGLSVAMIEARSLGGTSLNCGCTPKHVQIAAAQAFHEIERAAEHCITVAKPVLDWPALIERKQRMIRDIPDQLARAGAQVTIPEALPHLFGGVDADAAHQVRCESERIGIRILSLVWVKRIDRMGERLRVTFAVNGKDSMIEADRVVNSTGRIANIIGRDLGAGVVVHREGRIEIDEFLRSRSNPDVYVCGDALWNSPQLSPVAIYAGNIVGRNIVDGPRHRPDYAHIPASFYTVPSVASVGLTEAKARQQGREIEAHVSNMRGWLSARAFAETVA
ncbi:MAG: FAD-dependent oxidoreductase [Cypionkella sp.]